MGMMLRIIITLIVICTIYFLFFNEPGNKSKNEEKTLYERLGGIYVISGLVDHFSDAVINDPIAGKNSSNPCLKKWYAEKMDQRLSGLKWMRTLWVCDQAGGPYKYVPTVGTGSDLQDAHENLHISPEEFDAVAKVLSDSLDHFSVPGKEKAEVLAVFSKHKDQVNHGSRYGKCPFGKF